MRSSKYIISMIVPIFITFFIICTNADAQYIHQTKGSFIDKFRQLDEVLPTANFYRTAGGQPGHAYWQQQADYKIFVTLDEDKRRIEGVETITYKNNSPNSLKFLWLQLDQNVFKNDSMAEMSTVFDGPSTYFNGYTGSAPDQDKSAKLNINRLRRQQFMSDIELGYDIQSIKDIDDQDLSYTIVGTLMRIDLSKSLKNDESFKFTIKWAYNVIENHTVFGRNGYENFPNDARSGGNDIFEIAQWYPRLVAYTDYESWHNKEFLSRGEFTLEFGNFEVEITVPADHIVAATGLLQNSNDILTKIQRKRLIQAKTASNPVYIVTPDEALENEKRDTDKIKTWKFFAENVRDFAWASSRKFSWDAMGYHQPGAKNEVVLAMSFFPKEAGKLWENFSTETIAHTLGVYSRFSFDYPYPVAISVNGPVGGMEYPMISFNGPRMEKQDDGSLTYTRAAKDFLILIIAHEIGHNYFPMTVNSDERQWTWMDEGINTFLQSVAVREWNPDNLISTSNSTDPRDVIPYMISSNQVPVMTNSESTLQFWMNGYVKPAAALTILRETVLGRELFDFSFKEYANRWKFKRPTPADFFRTMEEASGVDLDWFWRGWFYSTDHVDISLDRIYRLRMDTENPDIDFSRDRSYEQAKPESISVINDRKQGIEPRVKKKTLLQDFYYKNDRFTVTNKDRNEYNDFLDGLKSWELKALKRAVEEDKKYYVLEFSNVGGLVMPIILGVTFTDGSSKRIYLPAEIWRRSSHKIKKLLIEDKEISEVIIDPNWETADADIENNYFPRRIIPSRIEVFKSVNKQRNLMHDIKSIPAKK